MSKLFVTFTAVLVVVAYHYTDAQASIGGTYDLKGTDFTPTPTPLPVIKVDPICKTAMEVIGEKCSNSTWDEWQNSSVHEEMIKAQKAGDHAKHEKLMTEIKCCAQWAAYDCAMPKIKGHCTSEDFGKITNEMDKFLMPFVEGLMKCGQFTFKDHDKICKK